MGKDVIIKNNAFFFKKCIDMNKLLKGTNYVAGYQDDFYRFTDKAEQSSTDTIVLYNKECITRGIYIDEFTSSKVHLHMPMPATQTDLDMLADLTKRIAEEWNAKTVLFDDESTKISEIDKTIEQEAMFNRGFLKGLPEMFGDKKCKSITIACVMWPIDASLELLTSFADDYPAFAAYLHKLQSIDAYFAAPQYHMAENGLAALYPIIEGNFILPDDPFVEETMEDGQHERCVKASVAFVPNVREAHNGEAQPSILTKDFMEFIDAIPESHKCKYDEKHTLYYNCSAEDLLAALGE